MEELRPSKSRGGTEVLFSQDRQHYLAYENQGRADGEDLTLYKRHGSVVWEGYDSGSRISGMTSPALNPKKSGSRQLAMLGSKSGRIA
jgi:hypothetical protein